MGLKSSGRFQGYGGRHKTANPNAAHFLLRMATAEVFSFLDIDL
jgi:hypothetical protein